jgi:ribonuclease BN (tRNA processing enzyme)
VRYFGIGCATDRPFRGHCLLSHLHWDHVQGLPFFTPLLQSGACLDVYAPSQPAGQSVFEVMAGTIRPPLFPVTLDELPGDIRFHDVGDSEFTLGELQIVSRFIPHIGPTCGYRITWRGHTVSYLSDHQQPIDGSFGVTDGALELCRGADVLIHDSQYTPDDFALKPDWGHCTIDYAVWLAAEAGVRTLVMFHHDPLHDDDRLDSLTAAAAMCGRAMGVEVVAAYEGLRLVLGG